MWKLITIEELNPTLGSLKLCAKNATWLDLFMANGVSPVAWVYQGENTVRSGLRARMYSTPALDHKFRGCRPVSFLEAYDVVRGLQKVLPELLP